MYYETVFNSITHPLSQSLKMIKDLSSNKKNASHDHRGSRPSIYFLGGIVLSHDII